MPRSWTDDQLLAAYPKATSLSDLACLLGISPSSGGGRKAIWDSMQHLDLCTEDLASRPRRIAQRLPLEDLLVARSSWRGSSSRLKARLVLAGLLVSRCAMCGLESVWEDKPLTLQLDHVNGDHYDNRVGNLRLVCPNCHSQTETFAGRNAVRGVAPSRPRRPTRASKKRPTKIDWPPYEALRRMVETEGRAATGRRLGVSGNAVKKRLARRK